MSKFGWSYPAGAANDPYAPYNQPDDPNEALYEAIYDAMEKASSDFSGLHGYQQDQIVKVAVKFYGDSYQQGYKQGQSDEGLARDQLNRNNEEDADLLIPARSKGNDKE